MFCIETVQDIVKVNASDLSSTSSSSNNTLSVLHNEIDIKYPNRVIVDVGLVICRYTDKTKYRTKIGHGVCQGSTTHWPISFAVIVFRPFVNEILIGIITNMSEEGVTVSLGNFFNCIYIPAYWMLNPSIYDKKNNIWVWTPTYDDDDEDDDENEEKDGEGEGGKEEEKVDGEEKKMNKEDEEKQEEEPTRYEMQIGAEIRVRVKSVHFTTVHSTAKGMHAVTTSVQEQSLPQRPVRKRSSSVGLDENEKVPTSAMHIIASICEDGLGLTSWWKDQDEEEEEEGEEAADDVDMEEGNAGEYGEDEDDDYQEEI